MLLVGVDTYVYVRYWYVHKRTHCVVYSNGSPEKEGSERIDSRARATETAQEREVRWVRRKARYNKRRTDTNEVHRH